MTRRILFYVLLAVQIGVISILSWQYFLIDHYGETIKLVTDRENYLSYQSGDFQGDIFLTYEINTIDHQLWEVDEEPAYHDLIYVLLEEDDAGIFHVQKASTEGLQKADNQIVLMSKYQYPLFDYKQHQVQYGFEKLVDQELHKDLSSHVPMVVTIKIAPWKQMKVVGITSQSE